MAQSSPPGSRRRTGVGGCPAQACCAPEITSSPPAGLALAERAGRVCSGSQLYRRMPGDRIGPGTPSPGAQDSDPSVPPLPGTAHTPGQEAQLLLRELGVSMTTAGQMSNEATAGSSVLDTVSGAGLPTSLPASAPAPLVCCALTRPRGPGKASARALRRPLLRSEPSRTPSSLGERGTWSRRTAKPRRTQCHFSSPRPLPLFS